MTTETTVQILLIISSITSLFLFFNRGGMFSKMNIHSVKLVWISEMLMTHLLLILSTYISALYLIYTENIVTNWSFKLATTLIIIILVWETIGFPGIFKAVDNIEFVDIQKAEKDFGDILFGHEVVGIVVNGEVRAYPLKKLMMNHIVNDTFGDKKIAITHCGLCNSSHAFNRMVNGIERKFHAAVPIIRSNLVIVDQKRNLWQQITGKALHGKNISDLEFIEVSQISWEHWKKEHPDTVVANFKYSPILKMGNKYLHKIIDIHKKSDGPPLFPTGRKADKLPLKTQCLGVVIEDKSILVPLSSFSDKSSITTTFEDKSLYIHYDHNTGIKFASFIKSETVTFDEKNNSFYDGSETLSSFKITAPVYYFAWMGTYPEAELISN